MTKEFEHQVGSKNKNVLWKILGKVDELAIPTLAIWIAITKFLFKFFHKYIRMWGLCLTLYIGNQWT